MYRRDLFLLEFTAALRIQTLGKCQTKKILFTAITVSPPEPFCWPGHELWLKFILDRMERKRNLFTTLNHFCRSPLGSILVGVSGLKCKWLKSYGHGKCHKCVKTSKKIFSVGSKGWRSPLVILFAIAKVSKKLFWNFWLNYWFYIKILSCKTRNSWQK